MPDVALPIWVLIVTSAAVGAVISGLATFMNAWAERRARRRELLLARALDLARVRTEMVLRIADKTGAKFRIRDDVFLAEGYFKWLSYLMDHGELPPDAKEKEAGSDEKTRVRAEPEPKALEQDRSSLLEWEAEEEMPEIEVTKPPRGRPPRS